MQRRTIGTRTSLGLPFLLLLLGASGLASGCDVEAPMGDPDVPLIDAPFDAPMTCEGETVLCGTQCVTLATDSRNCGECGRVCLPGTTCAGGTCDCRAPSLSCGGVCTDVTSDPAHCGSCDHACGAGEECAGSTCVTACPAETPDRCGAPGESTCVDLNIDPMNCGECGIGCVAGTLCVGGLCACPSGLTSCGVGRCVDTLTDPTNCGTCLSNCGTGGTCAGGVCTVCGGGLTACGTPTRCYDTDTSRLHCGSCGNTCRAGEACNAGTCECLSGLVDCGEGCTDLRSTRNHCGDCATDCGPTGTCVAGECSCVAGDVLCGRECANFDTSHEHCGGCDQPCGATEVCIGGSCAENDACEAGTVDVSAGGTFTGQFGDVTNDYLLNCHAGMFPDAAYRFTIPSDGMLRDVTLSGSTSGGMFSSTTYLQLTTNCAQTTSTVRCAGGTASLVQRELGPGTYYVLLESSAADATDWSLTVNIAPSAMRNPGDACSTAVDVTPTLDGMGMGMRTETVPIAMLEGDGGVSCGTTSPSARDAYFSITLTSPSDVTFRSSAGTLFHYTALQNTCGVLGSERRCRSGASPLAQIFRGLPAGTYYFVVQTTGTTGTLSVTAEVRPETPVAMNDSCPGIPLTVTGPVSRTDTVFGLEDDLVGGTCAGTGRPDAFYTFTLAAPRRVIISAASVTTTTPIYLTLRGSCTGTTTLGCAMGTPSASINQMLAAGTYIIQVEQALATAGDFSLDVF